MLAGMGWVISIEPVAASGKRDGVFGPEVKVRSSNCVGACALGTADQSGPLLDEVAVDARRDATIAIGCAI